MHDIFLSYSRKDTKIMLRVKNTFLEAGLDVWTDEGIQPGTQSWQDAIEKAIERSHCLVCILSPASKKSEWVREELNYARIHHKEIYPILAKGNAKTSVPFGITLTQSIDIRDEANYHSGMVRLTVAVGAGVRYSPDTMPPPPPPIETKRKSEPKPSFGSTISFLPMPFEWCDVPSGNVTLEAGGYIPAKGKTYHIDQCYMSKYPITNAQFSVFLQAFGRRSVNMGRNFNHPTQPVVGVNWHDAIAFCKWLSEKLGYEVTLPTEQQWQRAAQGDDDRIYPWGNDFNIMRLNARNKINSTSSVDQYEYGASPYGLFDMAGNVWEWCLTDYDSGNNDLEFASMRRILRGGSWADNLSKNFSVSFRNGANPNNRLNLSGFRIVYNDE